MFADSFQFLIDVLFTFFGSLLLLRAHMRWVGIGSSDPLSRFVVQLTNWVVAPLRRIAPPKGRLDIASCLAAYLTAVVSVAALMLIWTMPGLSLGLDLFWLGLLVLARWALNLIIGVTLVLALLSWINPQAPVMPLLNGLSAPFLNPIRRVMPLIGGVDLSPLVLFVIAQLGLIMVRNLYLRTFVFE